MNKINTLFVFALLLAGANTLETDEERSPMVLGGLSPLQKKVKQIKKNLNYLLWQKNRGHHMYQDGHAEHDIFRAMQKGYEQINDEMTRLGLRASVRNSGY